VTGDTEEPPAQRRRCVEDMWSPSMEVKSEVNQSVNVAPRATNNSLDDAAAAIRASMQTVVSDTLDDLIPAVASDDLISQMLNSAVGETELDASRVVRTVPIHFCVTMCVNFLHLFHSTEFSMRTC